MQTWLELQVPWLCKTRVSPTLKANDFSNLSSLQTLRLDRNDLSTLPDSVFSDLSSLTTLNLLDNDLSTLPAGVFSGLSSLTTLRLSDNSFDVLPDSVFSGLSSPGPTRLTLGGNPGAPFTLTLRLKRTDNAEVTGSATVKVAVAEGAPFDMTVTLSATGGTLSASTATISAGSIESEGITVTQTGTEAVTVSLGSAPDVPTDYRGISIAVGTPLVLFRPANRAPAAVGTIATQTLIVNGDAVTVDVSANFSDPDGDDLTYTATSDAETIATVSVSGSDVTIAPVSAGSATVTVTATDVTGSNTSVDQTITVTVNSLPVPTFSDQTIADQTYALNSQITPLVLPAAIGGNGTLTYALSPDADNNGVPDLPTGLSFNATTRTISGTPSTAFATTTFTYTATDADGDTAELMFTITVSTGICDRTSQVQTAILSEIDGVSDCGLVTTANLASIRGILNLNDQGITTLKANDFSNLSSLDTLRLKGNGLSALPAGVFSDLSSPGNPESQRQ